MGSYIGKYYPPGPKTEFGKTVKRFAADHDLSVKQVAEMAGVIPQVLYQCLSGRTPGYELVPKVTEFMATYTPAERR